MPRLSRNASKRAKRQRVHEEMGKFKRGTLHSGSKHGPVVQSRAQAQAIALSEAGMSNRGKMSKRNKVKRSRTRRR
jgi:hypothetical protein